MTNHTPDPQPPPDGAPGHPERTYVVQIGPLTLKYNETPIMASRILGDAGFSPAEEYVLELLKGAHGPAEQEFDSTALVPLDAAHARHLRAVPRGGGRA